MMPGRWVQTWEPLELSDDDIELAKMAGSIVVDSGTRPLPRIERDDGYLVHVICDGSRDHVLSYGREMRCSERRCVINKKNEKV